MFERSLDHLQPRRNYAFFIAPEEEKPVARIKVVGVGGGGCNAVSSMISWGLSGVEFIAINTDVQNLNTCLAPNKIQIGAAVTKGLGTGGNVELGRKAAEEDRDKISKALEGADMIFIATGLGGGTGTGSSPVISSIAQSTGALVVSVVTMPMTEEGPQKRKIAEKGLYELRDSCDSIIVVPNDRIELAIDKNASAREGYDKPHEVLFNAVKGISDVILKSGTINVDFADVKTVLRNSGEALMGIGRAKGENKVIEAVNNAISSPLLEAIDLRNAHSILINFSGSASMTFNEIKEAMRRISEMVNPNAYIKFGVVYDDSLADEVFVTVIATGYNRISRLSIPHEENELSFIKDSTPPNLNPVTTVPDDGLDFDVAVYNPDDDSIYQIPTYLRIKGQPKDDEQKDEKPEQDNNEDKNIFDDLKKKKNKRDDEDDSSALLRKLMD
ncbi:MAG: cell division protein FtsZ [Ignavibacteria bacterium]|nr:cell division protein FtsZ [Ignavibacteria bacterium]